MVIDKVRTGCGATTLAITQPRDTIIAVPYTALIVNKTSQLKHKDVLLGLYGHSDDGFKSVIADYLTNHTRIKIITTYDSLPTVCKTLNDLGQLIYNGTHLVIDEWHLMFTSYGYRGNATRGVLQEAERFQAVTYLSATPVERKYWFDEMLDLDEWTIQ